MRDTASILMLEGAAEPARTASETAAVGAELENVAIQIPAVSAGSVVYRERIATTAQILWIVSAVIGLCYFARSVVLPLALAGVAGMALKPPVRWLRDRGLPAPLAAALILAAFLAPIGFGISRVGGPAVEWIREAPENVVLIKERITRLFQTKSNASHRVTPKAPASVQAEQVPAPAVDLTDGRVATAVFTWTGSVLALIGEFVGLLFLLLMSGDAFLAKLVKVLPTLHDKRRAVQISHEIQQGISTYLFSVTIVNVLFGVVTGLVFSVAGLPHAAMWGAVAGALNFIPYFGPIIGFVAVTMSGLLAFEEIGPALIPGISYLLIHLVEANAITPMVLGRRFTLNPVIIFMMLIFFVWLWGVPGAFVAVPILVSAKVVCERLPAFRPLSEFLAR